MSERAVVVPSNARILVIGCGFGGLATAWWMKALGHRVTIVEIGPGLRKGGTPVDIKGDCIDIVRRMGLLDQIRASSLPPRGVAFLDADGGVEHIEPARPPVPGAPDEEYEIERDALLDLMYDAVAPRVDIRFGRTITHVQERADGVAVTFDDGSEDIFALVFGCDGMRSRTRRLVFGPDEAHLVFLKKYGALTIAPTALITPDVTQIHTTLGRVVMVNGYATKTDLGLGFHAEEPLEYDHRDKEWQRRLIRERFADMGGLVPDILAALEADDGFYFDRICQVRMERWSRGRIALVGDAACCPSPFSGLGGSLAIIGAAALHDAFSRHGGDVAAVFDTYERSFRPVVERVQAQATAFGDVMFAPATPEKLAARRLKLLEMR